MKQNSKLVRTADDHHREILLKIDALHTGFLALCLGTTVCLQAGESIAQDWVRAIGVPPVPIIALTEHHDQIYAISLDSVYRSSDAGLTWFPTPVQPGHADNLMAILAKDSVVYLGTTNDGIYRSSDAGAHWNLFSEGYPGSTAVEFLSLGDSIYVGTSASGVYVRSLTKPSPWAPYNVGLERFGVQTISSSGDLLVATIGSSTYARMRGGAGWTEILLDPAGGQLSVNRFYRFGDHLFAGVGPGVYRGNLDATGWQKAGINLLPYLPVEHFAAHGKRLLAGVRYKLEHFICYSDDEGANWGVLDHQLAELLAMRVVGNSLFAARADGLWYFDLGAPTSIGEPATNVMDFRLEQNYPNPFNPKTVVSSQVPVATDVRLVIYDMLGKEVAVLVNEPRAAGFYQDGFDASGLASGIYYYRLTAGIFVQTRAMMLLK